MHSSYLTFWCHTVWNLGDLGKGGKKMDQTIRSDTLFSFCQCRRYVMISSRFRPLNHSGVRSTIFILSRSIFLFMYTKHRYRYSNTLIAFQRKYVCMYPSTVPLQMQLKYIKNEMILLDLDSERLLGSGFTTVFYLVASETAHNSTRSTCSQSRRFTSRAAQSSAPKLIKVL